MFQDDTQPENQLERATPLPSRPASQDPEVQRKRMLIALGILLVALAAVLLRDWDFWFPPSGEEREATVRSKRNRESKSTPAAPAAPVAPKREPKPAKSTAPAAAEVPFSASTERAALPPLQVEVVAGNRHTNVPAKSNAIHLDVDSGTTSSGSAANVQVSAGDHVQLSPQTAQILSASVPPDYPLLALPLKLYD